jgi:phage replication-related protein YjqB (UPF0714/DUF867 family)
MKTFDPLSKKFRIGAQVREINRRLAIYKHYLFRLLSHPDTEKEHIDMVTDAIVDLNRRLQRANDALEAHGYDRNLII